LCLIVVAWRCRADLPLAVAANRDEWRDRPAETAHWWPDHPHLLAGRDLKAGGTWMGITRSGRFAAVTNFRDPAERRSTARSRGGLVTDFLDSDESAPAYLARIAAAAAEYNAFNLIVGDATSLWYYGSREGGAQPIAPGVHGLSNHVLDEPWPKVIRGRQAMERALGDPDPVPALFELLGDANPAPDSALPSTGVGLDWERRLSSALITGADYGTRASTVLLLRADGRVSFEERTRGADGSEANRAKHEFGQFSGAVPARRIAPQSQKPSWRRST
jgi:uncharacterized protein with NRDE domain